MQYISSQNFGMFDGSAYLRKHHLEIYQVTHDAGLETRNCWVVEIIVGVPDLNYEVGTFLLLDRIVHVDMEKTSLDFEVLMHFKRLEIALKAQLSYVDLMRQQKVRTDFNGHTAVNGASL